MANEATVDPARVAALNAATTFVSSWTGRRNADSVVFCARIFELYLRTGDQPDSGALRKETLEQPAD